MDDKKKIEMLIQALQHYSDVRIRSGFMSACETMGVETATIMDTTVAYSTLKALGYPVDSPKATEIIERIEDKKAGAA